MVSDLKGWKTSQLGDDFDGYWLVELILQITSRGVLHNITLTLDLPTRDHVTGHVISDLFVFYCSFGLFGICMHFG